MISDILPSGTAAAEADGGVLGSPLLPEEAASLGRVSEGRLREFTIARACARRALAALGLPPVPVPRGPQRQPLWPPGVVGSITHCAGYAAAAVAPRARLPTIGIDAEVHDVLPRGVFRMIAIEEERRRLAALPQNGICWDRVLFSAKESVYKAWFPLAGRWLGFEDVLITIEPGSGTIHARLLVPGPAVDGRPLTGFDGRYLIEEGHVLTAVLVAARHPSGGEDTV